MLQNIMFKFLGPNWRTSSSGIITVLAISTAYVINQDNSLVAFLPDQVEQYILGISKILAVVGGLFFALAVKDSHVTGGSVPQTPEAKSRVEKIELNLAEKARKKTNE
jgi:uncharacterized integral membrane protein